MLIAAGASKSVRGLRIQVGWFWRAIRVFSIGLAGVTIFASCGEVQGQREDILLCESPSGGISAVFYRRFGGGAAGWQKLYVAVRPNANSEEMVVLEMGHGYDVVLTWVSSYHLRVGYPSDANIAVRRRQVPLGQGAALEVEFESREAQRGEFVKDSTRCGGMPGEEEG